MKLLFNYLVEDDLERQVTVGVNEDDRRKGRSPHFQKNLSQLTRTHHHVVSPDAIEAVADEVVDADEVVIVGSRRRWSLW